MPADVQRPNKDAAPRQYKGNQNYAGAKDGGYKGAAKGAAGTTAANRPDARPSSEGTGLLQGRADRRQQGRQQQRLQGSQQGHGEARVATGAGAERQPSEHRQGETPVIRRR